MLEYFLLIIVVSHSSCSHLDYLLPATMNVLRMLETHSFVICWYLSIGDIDMLPLLLLVFKK